MIVCNSMTWPEAVSICAFLAFMCFTVWCVYRSTSK